MVEDPSETYRETLLIEAVADRLRVEQLAGRLGYDIYGPYVLVAVAFLAEYVVFDGYNHFIADESSLVDDPFSVMIGVGIVIAVLGVRYMADEYADAVATLRVKERPDVDAHTAFEQMFSRRVKLGIYVVGIGLYYLNLFFVVTLAQEFAIEGLVVGVGQEFVLFPLVYLPLMIDFVLVFVAIHFLLPRRIVNADLSLFFYDPRNMGGFAPVGELLKRSYYVYTAGLLTYFALIYGPTILGALADSPYEPGGIALAAFFTAAWLAGFLSIVHSMYRIHQLMSDEKERRIRRLEDRLRKAVDNPYDIENAEVVDGETFRDCRDRLEHVRNTREYPTTFTMWTQIALSAVVPQALNMAVQAAG